MRLHGAGMLGGGDVGRVNGGVGFAEAASTSPRLSCTSSPMKSLGLYVVEAASSNAMAW